MEETKKEIPLWLAFIIGIAMLLFIFFAMMGIDPFELFKKPTPEGIPCKRTVKEIMTVKVLDGGVLSKEYESVTGCEYPDGHFQIYPE